jgi:hypothetical protein
MPIPVEEFVLDSEPWKNKNMYIPLPESLRMRRYSNATVEVIRDEPLDPEQPHGIDALNLRRDLRDRLLRAGIESLGELSLIQLRHYSSLIYGISPNTDEELEIDNAMWKIEGAELLRRASQPPLPNV